MTQAQMLRYQRRQARMARERLEREQTAKVIVLIVFMLLAFGLAGAVDYHDRAMDLTGKLSTSSMEYQQW